MPPKTLRRAAKELLQADPTKCEKRAGNHSGMGRRGTNILYFVSSFLFLVDFGLGFFLPNIVSVRLVSYLIWFFFCCTPVSFVGLPVSGGIVGVFMTARFIYVVVLFVP